MRTALAFALAVLPLSAVSSAFATTYVEPVGTYTISAQTSSTGVHQSVDQGMLTGTLVFDSSSNITSANLLFHDTTLNSYTNFTVPGAVSTSYGPPELLSAVISNSGNSSYYFEFVINLPTTASPTGSFTLNCGTDCQDFAETPSPSGALYEEVTGSIAPQVTPEPSSLILLGTGLATAFGVARRRLL